MKSNLIKDTTMQERIELIRKWEETGGCESSGIDLMDFYDDYIRGEREIAEINADFTTKYISDIPEDESKGCAMGIPLR
ncbi:MAG: hypothetical protein PUE58_08230 [Lachnospiraceae bacterium]|nr:hypothetical protein [Lachnospiraceae bacterium]